MLKYGQERRGGESDRATRTYDIRGAGEWCGDCPVDDDDFSMVTYARSV